jgi:phosphoserine aminotransferase
MISFYPGPSRVYDDIPNYVKDAHREGILSMNHRSDAFISLCKNTVSLLKEKLDIPKSYIIFFTSSATECWEVIAQSLIKKESIHIYNGAFGEKWFNYTQRLVPKAKAIPFDAQQQLDTQRLTFKSSELICLTQNETSNGTQLNTDTLAQIKKQNPKHLIAVDTTSSMAGIELPFKHADIWFASVQKCFGLPAGLAVIVCSPKAIDQIKFIGENKHYNSLVFVNEMMAKWQTSYTPNVLGIYLLMRTLKKGKHIQETSKELFKRYQAWEQYFQHSDHLQLLIQNPAVRSHTVLTITGNHKHLEKVKANAVKEGFLLGEGYGTLKKETFRIANFPAIRKKEINKLMEFLLPYC